MDPRPSAFISYEEVSRLFGVHRRTVFRWSERGLLKKRKGRILRSFVMSVLPDWQRSVSLTEARKHAKITHNTCKSWREKGVLQSIVVLGDARVTKDSLYSVPQKRLVGFYKSTGSYHPGHLVRALETSHKTINKYLGKGIRFVKIDGKKLIPQNEVRRIESFFRGICDIQGASEILKIGDSGVRTRVKKGKLKKVTFLGKVYILLKSMDKDPLTQKRICSYLKKRNERVQKKIGFISKKRKKGKEKLAKRRQFFKSSALTKRRALIGDFPPQVRTTRDAFEENKRPKAFRHPKVVIPDYEPKVLVKEILGRRSNVITMEEASKATGMTVHQIDALMTSGTIRFCQEDEVKFPYYSAIKGWITRAKLLE